MLTVASASESKPGFPVRGLQLALFNSPTNFYKQVDKAARLGYNLILFSAARRGAFKFQVTAPGQLNSVGGTREELRALIQYSRQHGIEPVLQKRQPVVPFAKTRDSFLPLPVTASTALRQGEWETLEITLSPPDGIKPRRASIRVGTGPAASAELPCEVKATSQPLGFGVGFDVETGQPASASFPGEIRRLEMQSCL